MQVHKVEINIRHSKGDGIYSADYDGGFFHSATYDRVIDALERAVGNGRTGEVQIIDTNKDNAHLYARHAERYGLHKQVDSDLISRVASLKADAAALIEQARGLDGVDQRRVSIANTEIENGFIFLEHAINKAKIQ